MEIIKLSATNSTNTYLKELGKTIPLDDGVVVVTENQQFGRGQQDAVWQAESGKCLTFSLFKVLEEVQATRQFQISMLVGMAIVKALNKLNIPNLSLKWPNDIMSYNKKIGGVLIENQLVGSKVKSAIIGIGINCNEIQFDNLPNATSLRRITGSEYNLEAVMKIVIDSINLAFANHATSSYDVIRKDYEQQLFRIDKVWNFQEPNGIPFNGIIRGVTSTGQLLLEIENGDIKTYSLKEVKMIL